LPTTSPLGDLLGAPPIVKARDKNQNTAHPQQKANCPTRRTLRNSTMHLQVRDAQKENEACFSFSEER
jgi:hypothetical protein